MSTHVDVVVLGGGISGLAAACSARKAGASVMLLEAEQTFGGVMQTTANDGFLIEHGPTSMAATEHATSLLDDLGLTEETIRPSASASRRFVVRDGKMHPLPTSPSSLLSSDLLTFAGKLRLLAEPFVRRRTESDTEESLAMLIQRRFGSQVLDYFIDPFVSGVCAGDPAKLSSRYVLKVVGELEQEFGSVLKGALRRAKRNRGKPKGHIVALRGGMHQLPTAMRRTLGDEAVSGARVTSVAQSADQVDVQYTVAGETREVRANTFVCALPAHALDRVQWPSDWYHDLSRMQAVRYAPVCTVTMGFRREHVGHALNGFGVLIPALEQRAILGVLFNSSMFAERAPENIVLVTVFLGGARMSGDNAGRGLPTSEMCLQLAQKELTELIGLSGAPIMTSVARWPQGIPQLEVGHGEVHAAAAAIEKRSMSAFFTGSYLSGPAVGDCLEYSTAVGQRAAVATHVHGSFDDILAQEFSAPV